MKSTEEHVLYRFYSDEDALLYIGITNDPSARFSQHRRDQPWWRAVSVIRLERFDSRDAVAQAEREAIVGERPKYNKTYAGTSPESLRPRSRNSRSDALWSDARRLGRVVDVEEMLDARARKRRMWLPMMGVCPSCFCRMQTLHRTADDHGMPVGDSVVCLACGGFWTCSQLVKITPAV